MKTKRIPLTFDAIGPDYHDPPEDGDKALIDNLSAAAWAEPYLWVASDESASIERLTKSGDGFGAAKSFSLHDFFADLSKDKEVDIEALAYDPAEKALWVMSSHARSRSKTEDATPSELLDADEFDLKKRRCFLGRIGLSNGSPQSGGCASLPLGDEDESLRDEISNLGGALARSLDDPAKENGLDVEGLAVQGNTLLIGLRGPAVGGYAVVLRAVVETSGMALSIPEPLSVILLPLHGLAIRDLTTAEDGDVLVLAGPTFDLNAPFILYRWSNAFDAPSAPHVIQNGLTYLADLTGSVVVNDGKLDFSERPEALTMIGGELLVLHDRPAQKRRPSPAMVLADLLSLGDLEH